VLVSEVNAREMLGGISGPTIRRMVARGVLTPVDMGIRRRLYRYDDVVALAKLPNRRA
jgi:hypothetical protein